MKSLLASPAKRLSALEGDAVTRRCPDISVLFGVAEAFINRERVPQYADEDFSLFEERIIRLAQRQYPGQQLVVYEIPHCAMTTSDAANAYDTAMRMSDADAALLSADLARVFPDTPQYPIPAGLTGAEAAAAYEATLAF